MARVRIHRDELYPRYYIEPINHDPCELIQEIPDGFIKEEQRLYNEWQVMQDKLEEYYKMVNG